MNLYFSFDVRNLLLFRSSAQALVPAFPLVATVITLTIVFAGCTANTASTKYPARPIKLVVPFEPGGGTDTYARIIKKAFDDNELLPQPLVIINRGGAGATIGSRYVKNSPPDGYTVLLLHDAILTAQASGKVRYGPESFEAIAGTGEVGMVIAVRDDARWKTLNELMDDVKGRPNEIRFGANLGAPTHYAGLMLEDKAPGARFLFAQIGGGSQRLTDLVGGHIDVTGFSFEEYARFQSQGVRGLAYLAEKRHPAAPDLPTAKEQGFVIANANMFYWWFPKGTPLERKRIFADALHKAMATDYVKDKLAEIRFEPVFITGDELEQRIALNAANYADVAPRRVTTLPNIPLLIGLATLGILGVVVAQAFWSGKGLLGPTEKTAVQDGRRPWTALLAVVFTFVYAALLTLGWLDFRIATFLFVAAVGLLLAGRRWILYVPVCALACVTAVGVYHLFKDVFVIDL